MFPQGDGISQARIVEPEQVRPPDKSPEWLFGVNVDVDDKETVFGYFVTYDGEITNGEIVPSSEMVHMKVNTDLVIRRGLSDFFAAQESLQAVQELLRASVMGESVRQAIASACGQFSEPNNAALSCHCSPPILRTTSRPSLPPMESPGYSQHNRSNREAYTTYLRDLSSRTVHKERGRMHR